MNRSRGFTLVEVMMTVAILGVVTAMSYPSLVSFVQANRMTAQINRFNGLLYYARSEAVRRGARVTVCSSSTGLACSTDGKWESGRIVFVDTGTVGTKDGSDEIVRKQEKLDGDNTLRGSTEFANYISFLATGYADGATADSGSFRLCDFRGTSEANTVFINAAGRVRSAKTATSCP